MLRTILLAGVMALFATVAAAEYYQYTDENGNLRFTDDMTQIPESRREAVEKFASEKSSMMETEDNPLSDTPESPERTAAQETEVTQETNIDTGISTFEERAEELNRIQAQLNQVRADLEKEQAVLEAQAPGKNATNNEKIAYSAKVDALNARIDRYGKELKAFEEKVNAFNTRGQPQAP